jgi:hypothetical protein
MHPLKFGEAKHNKSSCFGYGDNPECWSEINSQLYRDAPRLQKLVKELQWRESLPGGQEAKDNIEWFAKMKSDMEGEARRSGLIKGTMEWKLRFKGRR